VRHGRDGFGCRSGSFIFLRDQLHDRILPDMYMAGVRALRYASHSGNRNSKQDGSSTHKLRTTERRHDAVSSGLSSSAPPLVSDSSY
jgi:hypothetical protein